MTIYAQLGADGVCYAVTETAGAIVAPNIVEVDTYDVLGKKYNEASGGFDEVAAAPTVPQSVSRFQAHAALLLSGHLDTVKAMMANEATPALDRLAWENALEFKRQSQLVLTMAPALGLSPESIDQLFIVAAQIEV